jgi:hypothetical protein
MHIPEYILYTHDLYRIFRIIFRTFKIVLLKMGSGASKSQKSASKWVYNTLFSLLDQCIIILCHKHAVTARHNRWASQTNSNMNGHLGFQAIQVSTHSLFFQPSLHTLENLSHLILFIHTQKHLI